MSSILPTSIFHSPFGLSQRAPEAERENNSIRSDTLNRKPNRAACAMFGRGDLAVRGDGLWFKVACPTQRVQNLKGRCLFLWPFDCVSRWSRRTADALPTRSGPHPQQTGRQSRANRSFRACASVCLCAVVCALNCASVCARMARENRGWGAERNGYQTEFLITPCPR